MLRVKFLLACITLSMPLALWAQDGTHLVPMYADSIPVIDLPDLTIEGDRLKKRADMRREERRMTEDERLKHNVRLLYPFAYDASLIMKRIDAELGPDAKRKNRKAYMARLEKDLFKKYENRLRMLSVNQGRILVKLIDRQTGDTVFDIIKEYRSGTTAVFWQLVAKLFGNNLKTQYDPTKEAAIEAVCVAIENGTDAWYPLYLQAYQRSEAQRLQQARQ